jgi:glycosyltransferase involved in cell wall biosynthesis
MKRAFVYDWLAEGRGGGEATLEEILRLFPSPIYTLLADPKAIQEGPFSTHPVYTSFIQKLPFALKRYRSYLPLYPWAIEQFDLSSYDLILSCSHCVAKGVLTHADQLHLCYCYTPMRYAWDLYHDYLKGAHLDKGIKGRLAQLCLHYLRSWDIQSLSRVDHFGAISHCVARRIQKIYQIKATVIYPPVDTTFFSLHEPKESFYMTASRLVSYKKIDVIVQAFANMPNRKLIVVGDGPERRRIEAMATSNVEILGHLPKELLCHYLQRARAFIFAAVEDFGILPVEAMSTGTPVIGYGKGALLETVQEGISGLFFHDLSPSAIVKAVEEFEWRHFDPSTVRSAVLSFGTSRFVKEFSSWVTSSYQTFQEERKGVLV